MAQVGAIAGKRDIHSLKAYVTEESALADFFQTSSWTKKTKTRFIRLFQVYQSIWKRIWGFSCCYFLLVLDRLFAWLLSHLFWAPCSLAPRSASEVSQGEASWIGSEFAVSNSPAVGPTAAQLENPRENQVGTSMEAFSQHSYGGPCLQTFTLMIGTL